MLLLALTRIKVAKTKNTGGIGTCKALRRRQSSAASVDFGSRSRRSLRRTGRRRETRRPTVSSDLTDGTAAMHTPLPKWVMYGRRPRCKRESDFSAKRSGAVMYSACCRLEDYLCRDAATMAAGPDVIR